MASDDTAWAGERVPERAVVNHWLAAERRKPTTATRGAGPVGRADGGREAPLRGLGPDTSRSEPGIETEPSAAVSDGRAGHDGRADRPSDDLDTGEGKLDALDDDQALDALLRRKPGAAAFLWRARPIRWQRIEVRQAEFERLRFVDGPDGLGWRALAPNGDLLDGARRIMAEERATLETETGIDVERVRSMAETLADGGRFGALVLTRRRGRGRPAIADGNHRATAIALHSLRTGEYRPQRAYLGTGTNPVLEPLYQRLRGAFVRARRSDDRRW